MLRGWEREPGSFSPKHPTHSAVASRGRNFRRCASLPKSWMAGMTRLDCTDMAER